MLPSQAQAYCFQYSPFLSFYFGQSPVKCFQANGTTALPLLYAPTLLVAWHQVTSTDNVGLAELLLDFSPLPCQSFLSRPLGLRTPTNSHLHAIPIENMECSKFYPKLSAGSYTPGKFLPIMRLLSMFVSQDSVTS